MFGYICKRIGLALLVAFTVSVLAFFLLHLSGDPAIAMAGEGAREADIEAVRKAYGPEVARNPWKPEEQTMLSALMTQADDGTKLQLLGAIASSASSRLLGCATTARW